MKKIYIVSYLIVSLFISTESFGALIAQFDGSQVTTTNGTEVVEWSNQAGFENAKGLGDSSTFPLAVPTVMPNGTTRTVIDFDGSNDCLTMGSDTNNYDGNSFTWIIVYKNGDTNQNGKALLANTYQYTYGTTETGNNPVWQTFANSGNNVYVATRDSTGGFKGRSTGSGTSDEWHVMTGKWNGSSLYAYLDGSYLGSSSGATADPTGHIRTRIGSGSSGTPGAFFNGQIAEVRIYNEVLDDSTREAVEEDLMNKYIIIDPDMVAFYDGTSLVESNGLVESWNNQGVGGDATASGDYRPTAVSEVMPNGTTHTVLDFNGTNALVIGSDPENYDTNTFTWFAVVKSDTYDSTGVIHKHSYASGADNNANAMWGDFRSTNGKLYSYSRTSTGEFKSGAFDPGNGNWHLVEVAWDGNTGELKAWHDGGLSSGGSTGVNANPSGHQRSRIGADAAGGTPTAFFQGQIAELRIYNVSMIDDNDSKRIAIEDELMTKYFNATTPADFYNTWANYYSLSNAAAAMDADPDGDELSNLGEYAFGGSPIDPNDLGYGSGGEIVTDGGSNWLEYVHPQRIDADSRGLEYFVETNPDLMYGSWSTNGVSIIGTGVLDDEFLSVTSRVSTVEGAKFMRFWVNFTN